MSHKLKSISIAGYKSIREATVELRDLNVLIGANGAGKSNLISAFGMMRELVEGRLGVYVARRGGANALLHFGRKVTERIKIRLDFHPNGYEASLAPNDTGGLFFEEEKCSFHAGGYPKPYDEHLGSGHTESKLRASEHGIPHFTEENLKSWRVFHFHDVSEAALVKQQNSLGDHQFLRADGKNLASFLYRLRNAQLEVLSSVPDEAEHFHHSYQRILRAIRQVAPYFDDFVLEPDGIRPDLIQLAWREQGSDENFFASALSDGTLRFICLATLLLQPAGLLPSLIIIDEPELGLHPFAIHQLAALLKAASTRTQVIVSTQSVTLINQLEAKDLIVVDRKIENGRGYSDLRRISDEEISQWTSDYGLGEIWEKNIIGGRPR
jgi:predicted ATPase